MLCVAGISIDKRDALGYNKYYGATHGTLINTRGEFEIVLREIKENTYVFSVSRESFGRIIAHRSRDGDGCDDVFERLGINDEDVQLITDFKKSSGSDVLLWGKRDGRKSLVVVLRGLAYEASVCIAVEVYDKPEEVLRMLYAPESESFICSRGVNESILRESFFKFDSSALTTVKYILGLVELCKLDLGRAYDHVLEISDVITSMADLVGIRLTVNCTGYGAHISDSGTFFNKLCIASIICLAMEARAESLDRTLRVEISCESERLTLSLEYSLYGEAKCLGGEFISSIFDIYGIPSMLLFDNNRVCFGFTPQCSDIGLVGVKNPLSAFNG